MFSYVDSVIFFFAWAKIGQKLELIFVLDIGTRTGDIEGMEKEPQKEKEVIPMLSVQELWKGNFSPDVNATFVRAKAALEKEHSQTEN